MRPSTPRRLCLVATIALVIVSAADSAMGQQFGRSQVRHRTFEFRVLRTEHFAIYYYAEATDAVRMAGRMAERWHTRLTEVLAHDLQGEQPLILYAAPGHSSKPTSRTRKSARESAGSPSRSAGASSCRLSETLLKPTTCSATR